MPRAEEMRLLKQSVWKYGLASGLVLAVLMGVTVPFEHHIKATYGMVIGRTIMLLSFLIVFVGVKHYRDTDLGGVIGLAARSLMVR